MDIPSYLLGRIKGSGGAGVNYVVVEELPTTGEEGKIYLVPKEDSQTDNVYNEYMYIEDEWELIGDTQADLSDYLQESDLKTINGNSIVGSGDLSIEPKYITDGDGNKLYFVRYSTDVTYKQNVLFPALEQLISDYDNGIKSFIYIGEEYTDKDYIPEYNYRSSIFFIQKVKTYSDLKQYYVKSTQVGPIKMNGAFQMQRTYYDGYIDYVISTGKVSSININNTKNNFINILQADNTTAFTPTGDYNPATKKYVDDSIASAIGTALQGNY